MLDWRTLNYGDSVVFNYREFDGTGSKLLTVGVVEDDHAMAWDFCTGYWIDDDTAHMFELA